MIHPSKSEVRPATILVDVQLQKTAAEEHGASLQELRQLVETLGWDIAGTVTQKLQSPTAVSLIGPGKLNELSELVKAPSMAESVVFDQELTPRKRETFEKRPASNSTEPSGRADHARVGILSREACVIQPAPIEGLGLDCGCSHRKQRQAHGFLAAPAEFWRGR